MRRKTNENLAQKAAIPNPLLKPFDTLIGEWKTIGYHPYLPGMVLHGHTSFHWIEDGAFLMMRSENDEGKIPAGIAIFGSDDATGELFMLYFDERKVSRKYEVSFQDKVLKWWRNDPAFSNDLPAKSTTMTIPWSAKVRCEKTVLTVKRIWS